MKGTITDIHRTSVVDGPGLRTTVFLKSCPLSCLWCHNPETQRGRVELALNVEKCTGCGDCIPACPVDALSLHDGKIRVNRARCTDCGQCAAACPSSALLMYGREVTDDEIVAEVLKDRDYYEASGGGVTISGGEPLSQAAFALSLLQKCRQAGIHTVLDTTGYMPRRSYERSLDVTSLYLFDYKATGEQLHRRLTGVSLQPILATLDFLLTHGAAVILRCPMIPGVNDQVEHLAAIADIAQQYPTLEGIEILPWHTMGNAKYARLDKRLSEILPTENTPESAKARYRDFFAINGPSNKVRVV